MRKKIIIGLTVLLLFVAAGIYLAGKESWKEEMELFGPLNVMQQDAQLTTNDGDAVYTVSRKKDIQISNEFHIYKGTVSLTIYLNGDQIYQKDIDAFGERMGMSAKPNPPENTFPVSMIPWTSFEGFNLNLKKGYDYLLPIFTFGKYYEEGGKYYIPLSIQVHHAVCDGFHVCRFLDELQDLLNK